jgi:hypothetical protein
VGVIVGQRPQSVKFFLTCCVPQAELYVCAIDVYIFALLGRSMMRSDAIYHERSFLFKSAIFVCDDDHGTYQIL